MYEIQYLSWYNWITVMSIPDDPNMVPYYMEQVKSAHPDSRIRCVDNNGRLIDSIG